MDLLERKYLPNHTFNWPPSVYFPFLGKERESSAYHVESFDLSSVRALDSYWGTPRVRSASGAERDQDLRCYRAKMILLDAAETHLREYVKLRYVIYKAILVCSSTFAD